MIEDQLEFQISQYADGTLPESERALVELRLLSNTEARALLEEYRTLDASLKSSMVLPAVNWDRLADHLSEAVVEVIAEQREARAATVLGRIGFAGRLAIAACVVLAVGGVAMWTAMDFDGSGNTQLAQDNPDTGSNTIVTPPDARPAALVVVRGPAPEGADAPPIVVVSVGPSSRVTPNWRAAEGVVTGPSRVIWIASTYDGAQDTQRLPY